MPTPKREDAASSPAVAGAGAPAMLGVPFTLPNGALMPLGNAQSADADELSLGGAAASAATADKRESEPEQKTELSLQQQQLVHQQLQQQQLQLLQFQQQQLQNMSPSDLSAVAAMAHQMALGMVMMPMMPFMMPMNGAQAATTPSSGSSDQHASSSDAASSPTANGSSAIGAESLELAQGGEGFGSQASPLTMMGGAPFGLSAAGHDDTPKRKRGRPPKKDVVARAKVEAEKTLKQFPMWGYGVPMPLLPGFPGILPPNLADQTALQTSSAQEDAQQQVAKDEDSDSGYDKTGRARTGKGPAKKKARGTGKPRGRPRTRPRPGEIIRRAKPPAIAPANYSVMYNYSLSNLAQKTAEMANDAANASSAAGHEDNRLANLGVSLLSNEHE